MILITFKICWHPFILNSLILFKQFIRHFFTGRLSSYYVKIYYFCSFEMIVRISKIFLTFDLVIISHEAISLVPWKVLRNKLRNIIIDTVVVRHDTFLSNYNLKKINQLLLYYMVRTGYLYQIQNLFKSLFQEKKSSQPGILLK